MGKEVNKSVKKLLLRVKLVKWHFNLIVLYYVIYNTIYGWNTHPIDDTEKLLDHIAIFALWVGVGFIISILLDFIVFVVNKLS